MLEALVLPELANCKRCGKVFIVAFEPYCRDCLEVEEELFREVRDYLYSNPGSDVSCVSKATGVPVNKILEYIRSGRIG